MTLVVDSAAASRRISEAEFAAWAATQTVFLSSVMGELSAERRYIAKSLEALGLNVRWFEGLGGRDDSAQVAYLSEVAGADIYVGLLANDYGGMLTSGFSATHDEYLEARRRGRRITFWACREDSAREGHARNFLAEVQLFQVTGGFDTKEDLLAGLERRLREMAAEDLAPWVKLAEIVFRATSILDRGDKVTVIAEVRDSEVFRALQELAPGQWGRSSDVPVTYSDRSGQARVDTIVVETRSQAIRTVTLGLTVDWATGGDSMAAGTLGYSAQDLTELGIRAGLLGEPLPGQLSGFGSFADTTDPLGPLSGVRVPEGSLQAVARLLVVERLVGQRKAAAVERFTLGPLRSGRRHVELAWREPRIYSNAEPERREITGERLWH